MRPLHISHLVCCILFVWLSSTFAWAAGTPSRPLIIGSVQEGVSGLQQDAEGWTILRQFLATEGTSAGEGPEGIRLSRLVYISASGNDEAAAKNPHGRGYYLPSDPEVGADPTEPTGPIVAYATFGAAARAVRRNGDLRAGGADMPRYPDWVLFERGGQYDLKGLPLTLDVNQGGPNAHARRVYTAYGRTQLQRPSLFSSAPSGASVSLWGVRGGSNVAVTSLDFAFGLLGGVSLMYGASDILIEDSTFQRGLGMAQFGATDLVIRRNAVYGAFSPVSHVQGFFVAGVGSVVLEENVFDMNGYKEDPTQPQTWTASAISTLKTGAVPAGTGIQPTRTWFDRNLYLSSYDRLLLVKNIISRGGGGGSVQMRVGGIAKENVFLFNQAALGVGHPQSIRTKLQNAEVLRNLVLHDDIFLPPGGYGHGLTVGVGSQKQADVSDNVVAHFHGLKSNGGAMLQVMGIGAFGETPAERASFARMSRNAVIATFATTLAIDGPDSASGVERAEVGGNAVIQLGQRPIQLSGGSVSFDDLSIGSVSSGANDYFSPLWSDFDQWRAAGYDTASRRHGAIDLLARTAGWRTAQELQDKNGVDGWSRDIVSYMQAIDPKFVSDENVRVDAGVPPEFRRADAPMVWEAALQTRLSEYQAKQAARRYHAFLIFIERARKNRRGSWDYRYTSDAINNYIRQGLGKTIIQ